MPTFKSGDSVLVAYDIGALGKDTLGKVVSTPTRGAYYLVRFGDGTQRSLLPSELKPVGTPNIELVNKYTGSRVVGYSWGTTTDGWHVRQTPTGILNLLTVKDGWEEVPPPFVFPTKKYALIKLESRSAASDAVFMLQESGKQLWTDTYNGAVYGDGWFFGKDDRLSVIFEGVDE